MLVKFNLDFDLYRCLTKSFLSQRISQRSQKYILFQKSVIMKRQRFCSLSFEDFLVSVSHIGTSSSFRSKDETSKIFEGV